MTEQPRKPAEALSSEQLQRFAHTCAHERHSPMTHRLMDASSYGWVHRFIRAISDDAGPAALGDDWLDPHDADPEKVGEFFGRVAVRLRDTDIFDYVSSLQAHFDQLAESRQDW